MITCKTDIVHYGVAAKLSLALEFSMQYCLHQCYKSLQHMLERHKEHKVHKYMF